MPQEDMLESTHVTEGDVENFPKSYDAIAQTVMADTQPSVSAFGCSHSVMAACICEAMDWQDIDLFVEHDFEAVYAQADEPVIQAYAMIAFLREQVFRQAEEAKIGDSGFNQQMWTYANVWHVKLVEILAAKRQGKSVQHRWIN